MADIIDLQSRKVYHRDAESEASLVVDDLDPVDAPTSEDMRMARALLIAQTERENAEWVAQVNARSKRVSTCRASFLILGLLFGILQWWWALGASIAIILLAKKLVK